MRTLEGQQLFGLKFGFHAFGNQTDSELASERGDDSGD
jgi:hypothetical protein